ncbi:MAG TPA: LysM peptidoglycan-binding domain-containing protein, partial [Stellaceae bacterium]|nr:LysM peptidoglycan-binding domain-containing protein [Stellaceae bacterium]
MGLDIIRRCGIVRSGLVAILTGLVGACADQSEPAPVFQRGAADQVTAPMSAPSSSALQVTVRRGQTLGGYAYTYHVSKSAIIAANGLQPPYELKIGQRLTIPVSGRSAPVRTAAAAPYVTPPGVSPSLVRSEALPPPAQPVATPQPPPVPQTLSPPPAAAKAQPEVISLDGPPPKESAAAQPPAPASQRLAQATLTPPPFAAAPMTAGPAVTSP